MPAEVGSCENETNYIRRYFFDDIRGTCLSFIYSGCDGNENNFPTYESCLEKCQDSKLYHLHFVHEIKTKNLKFPTFRPSQSTVYDKRTNAFYALAINASD
jgi:hypothetical protein